MKLITRYLGKKRKRKAQTALEYALVVGAISLVVMAAWNVVGVEVKKAIETTLKDDVMKNIQHGNHSVPSR
jgi:Flp pilus assembly pilin Flp